MATAPASPTGPAARSPQLSGGARRPDALAGSVAGPPPRWCNPFRYGRAFLDVADALGAARSRAFVLLPDGGVAAFPIRRRHDRDRSRVRRRAPSAPSALAPVEPLIEPGVGSAVEVRIEGDRVRISRADQTVRLVFSLNAAAREPAPVLSVAGLPPWQWIHAPAGSPALVVTRLRGVSQRPARFRCALDACVHLAATGFHRPGAAEPATRRHRTSPVAPERRPQP